MVLVEWVNEALLTSSDANTSGEVAGFPRSMPEPIAGLLPCDPRMPQRPPSDTSQAQHSFSTGLQALPSCAETSNVSPEVPSAYSS